MYLISVIPIARHALSDELSYRSKDECIPGTIVRIPFRTKEILGIVTSSTDVRNEKTALKQASFQTRNITLKTEGSLPSFLIKAIEKAATYHALKTGSTYHALIKEVYLPFYKTSTEFSLKDTPKEIYLEEPQSSRLISYRKHIHNALVHHTSAIIAVPTIPEATRLSSELAAEFGTCLHVLTSKTTKRNVVRALESAQKSPGVFIMTPSFLAAPLPRVAVYIFERSGAGSWRSQFGAPFDFRIFGKVLAKEQRALTLEGDFPLRSDVRPRTKKNPSETIMGTLSIIPMNKPKEDVRKSVQKKPFRVIAPELEKRIHTLQKKRVPVVLIAVRRGYAPLSICRDCETTVTDKEGRPLTLYTNTKGERSFRDTYGKVHMDADISCNTCGGWNIIPLGIGIERVQDTLTEMFPRSPLACFSSPNETTTPKLLEDALHAGSLIVGSEALLALLPENIQEIAIVSADSLLALPFYRTRERFLRLVLLARERSRHVTVQTRKEDLVKKMMDAQFFFKEEHALRTQFRYPPEWRLVHIHTEGAGAREKTIMETVREQCSPWSEDVIARKTSEGKAALSLLLRVRADIWPEPSVVKLLQSLPPSFRVVIDPESIL